MIRVVHGKSSRGQAMHDSWLYIYRMGMCHTREMPTSGHHREIPLPSQLHTLRITGSSSWTDRLLEVNRIHE